MTNICVGKLTIIGWDNGLARSRCQAIIQTNAGILFMMTSSNGNIFRVTGPLCGEFTGHWSQRPVTRNFDVFFDLRLNKRLSKQPRGWWFETPPWSLWRRCNVIGPLGTNLSEILIRIQTFLFRKMHLLILSVEWCSFYVGLCVLTLKQPGIFFSEYDFVPDAIPYKCNISV